MTVEDDIALHHAYQERELAQQLLKNGRVGFWRIFIRPLTQLERSLLCMHIANVDREIRRLGGTPRG